MTEPWKRRQKNWPGFLKTMHWRAAMTFRPSKMGQKCWPDGSQHFKSELFSSVRSFARCYFFQSKNAPLCLLSSMHKCRRTSQHWGSSQCLNQSQAYWGTANLKNMEPRSEERCKQRCRLCKYWRKLRTMQKGQEVQQWRTSQMIG